MRRRITFLALEPFASGWTALTRLASVAAVSCALLVGCGSGSGQGGGDGGGAESGTTGGVPDPTGGEPLEGDGGGPGSGSGQGSGETGSGAGSAGSCEGIGVGGASGDVVEIDVGAAVVETYAGSEDPGSQDGPRAQATFSNPVNVVKHPDGSLLVADFDSGKIRRIDGDGVVSTLASGLTRPFGLALGDGGELYVETDGNPEGEVTDQSGSIYRVSPDGDLSVVAANLGRPRGLAVAPAGRPDAGKLYLADIKHHTIRKLDVENGKVKLIAGTEGCAGYQDGALADAKFQHPYGLAFDREGNLLVADFGNNAIRRVTLDGEVETVAGAPQAGMVDGPLDEARFYGPKALAFDPDGRLVVSDTGNLRIRRVEENRVVTLAGDGVEGFADGAGDGARFYGQEGLAVVDLRTLVVADGTRGEEGQPYHRLRRVTLSE